MRSYITKASITMFIVYLLTAGVLFSFYLYYSQEYSDNQSKAYAQKAHLLYTDNLKIDLHNHYEQFLSYVSIYSDVDTLNTHKEDLLFGQHHFINFYTMTPSGILIDGNLNNFKSTDFNQTYSLDISFYALSEVLENHHDSTLYGVFRVGDIIGLFDGRTYLESYVPNDSFNGMILRSNGFVLISYEPTSAKLLSAYIDTSTTQLINQVFANKESGTAWTSIGHQKTLMAYAPVSDGLPLYYMSFFEEGAIAANFEAIHLFFIAALLIIGIIFVLSNVIIFYITYIRFNEIENSKLKVYYNKRIMLRMSKSGKIISYNKSFKALVPNYKKYKNIKDFTLEDTSFESNLMDRIKKHYAFNIKIETPDDDVYVRLSPVRMGLSYVLIGENMTEDDTVSRAYESLALVSRITDLPNYNYFMQFLNEHIKKNVFMNEPHIIIGINIVDFKNINKLIGETLANELLKDLSKIIHKSLTDMPHVLFNTYIDNFFIVFKGIKDVDVVERWFEQLWLNVESQSELIAGNMYLDLRAGIYEINLIMGEQITPKQVFNRVMTALKYANESTTSKTAKYDMTLRSLATHQKKIELGLIESIKKKEFEIFLQPQLDIKTNKIVAFESLIRWSNPEFINVKPSEFIKLAEASNLIVDIGLIAMEKTMQIAKKLENLGVTIAMNVSPVQMIQKGFVSVVEEMLRKYQIKPGIIAIEITETYLISSMQMMSEKLKSLQKLGIDIHLDDFGMGYSSLLYLKDLPINVIKIDKSFVDYITTDKYSKAIANMVVTLSKHIGVDVVAEGVETKDQIDALSKIGIQIVQGYYVAKALPFDEALDLLKKYNKKN